ncbi:MAG: GxxExxY protein [Saprospiraceae bacterium]
MFIKDYLHQIEAAAFNVFCQLGRGQQQAIYKQKLIEEFTQQGVPMVDFTNEIRINETIIIQVFATPSLKPIVEDKFTNHLTSTNTELGYIVNFGLSTQVLRKFKRDRII